MEKNIALWFGVIASIVSYIVDGIGIAVTVLIVLMAIDYITGLMVGIVTKTLNSRIGFNGIIRKFYYLFLVASVYLIALVVPNIGYIGDGAAIALCVLEFVSITENGVKIGAPVPKYIQNILLIIQKKTDGDENESIK